MFQQNTGKKDGAGSMCCNKNFPVPPLQWMSCDSNSVTGMQAGPILLLHQQDLPVSLRLQRVLEQRKHPTQTRSPEEKSSRGEIRQDSWDPQKLTNEGPIMKGEFNDYHISDLSHCVSVSVTIQARFVCERFVSFTYCYIKYYLFPFLRTDL